MVVVCTCGRDALSGLISPHYVLLHTMAKSRYKTMKQGVWSYYYTAPCNKMDESVTILWLR